MKSILKEVISTVITSFIIVMLIVNFLFTPVHIQGHSMDPTLFDGAYGIAGIFNRFFGLERFDIVTIELEDKDEFIIKRVIGLPNETIEMKDQQLYVNHQPIDEPYLSTDVYTENFKVTLKDDEYFVMGDNREHSSDSRFYGPFKNRQIKTRGVFILF